MSGPTNEFGMYLQAIKNRFWLVLLLVVVAVGAVYWSVGRQPSRYSASALMMVTAPVFARTGGFSSGDIFQSNQTQATNDIQELLTSRTIATRVAKRLDLPGPLAVQRSLSAMPERGTSMIRLTATARDPERAAALANTTADEFISYFRETNRNSVSEARRFVEEQLALSRARLEQSDRTLQTFREARRIISPTDASSRVISAVNNAEAEIETVNRTRDETDARLAAVRERLARERPIIVASRATAENPAFRRIEGYLLELEIRRTQMAQVYTPQHPRMEALTREIADVRNRLLAEARTSVNEEVTTSNPIHGRLVGDIITLEVERAVVNARAQALQVTLRRRQQEVASLPSTEAEYNRLNRENRILEGNYTTLASRYQDMLLRENEAGFSPASLQLIEAAIPAVRADASAFPRFGAAAGMVGFVLGILGALLLEALDDRIRSAQDAERALGVPVLAQIPAQGQPRVAPAPAVFVVILLLAVGAAWLAVSRGFVSLPTHVSEQVRGATAWMGSVAPSAAGIATDSR